MTLLYRILRYCEPFSLRSRVWGMMLRLTSIAVSKCFCLCLICFIYVTFSCPCIRPYHFAIPSEVPTRSGSTSMRLIALKRAISSCIMFPNLKIYQERHDAKDASCGHNRPRFSYKSSQSRSLRHWLRKEWKEWSDAFQLAWNPNKIKQVKKRLMVGIESGLKCCEGDRNFANTRWYFMHSLASNQNWTCVFKHVQALLHYTWCYKVVSSKFGSLWRCLILLFLRSEPL